jgi:hypothetical protein
MDLRWTELCSTPKPQAFGLIKKRELAKTLLSVSLRPDLDRLD